MWSFRRVLFAVLLALVTLVGATACGGDEEPAGNGVPLPKDFPTAQVPLVDGAVLSAEGSDPQWQITVQAPANEGNAFDNAVTKLTQDSYVESSRSETTGEKSVLLSRETDGKTYWVTVGISAAASASASTIMYSVTVT